MSFDTRNVLISLFVFFSAALAFAEIIVDAAGGGKKGATMTRNTFGFGALILVSWLISTSTVEAGVITQSFDRDPGWASYNLPVNDNDFSFRDTSFAGGNAGEAGGFFSKTNQVSWYGDDAIGILNEDDTIGASGQNS